MTPVLVLNLDRSADRRDFMRSQFARLGVEAEFVLAVDGGARAWPPGLSAAEWGCLESHRSVWSRVANSESSVILEDDVRLDASFPQLVSLLGNAIRDRDLLLLGHHSARRTQREGALVCRRSHALGRWTVARVAEFAMGAYAYLLTPVAARLLLAFSDARVHPADWFTGYAEAAGVRVFAVSPPAIVTDTSFSSTIRSESLTTDPKKSEEGGRSAWSAFGRLALEIRRLGFFPGSYVFHPASPFRPGADRA